MWGKTVNDFENEEQELAVAMQNLLSKPALADFTFSKRSSEIQLVDFKETNFPETVGKSMQFGKGATTLASVYEPATPNDKGGILVAVDSRASSREYISYKSVMKMLDIGDRLVATMAGGAADCQFWTKIVGKYCTLYELPEKDSITVSSAIKYSGNMLYGYRGQGLSVGAMVAGYDKKGPQIFKFDSKRHRCQLEACSVGLESLNACGILDDHDEPKMTGKEARKLGLRAIIHATYHDSESGGVCNLWQITPAEKIRLSPMDVRKLWYEFADELGKDIGYNRIAVAPRKKASSASSQIQTVRQKASAIRSTNRPRFNKKKTIGNKPKTLLGYDLSSIKLPETAHLFYFEGDVAKIIMVIDSFGKGKHNQFTMKIGNGIIQNETHMVFEKSDGNHIYLKGATRFPQSGDFQVSLKIRDTVVANFNILVKRKITVFVPCNEVVLNQHATPILIAGENVEEFDILNKAVTYRPDVNAFPYHDTPQISSIGNKRYVSLLNPLSHDHDGFQLVSRMDGRIHAGHFSIWQYATPGIAGRVELFAIDAEIPYLKPN
ncbi:unnamed protein product [Caenorhabditis nigoni]